MAGLTLSVKVSNTVFCCARVGHGRGAADVRAVDEGKLTGRRASLGKSALMTMAAVQFNGLLSITDVEVFRQALEQGIGSAKAYGFGLLSVARTG